MSTKTVDQRVVEMRFDNRNFEKNVSTTMSSLDKLKQKLNFKGATKGFENIDSASKKVNMNGLASAVDTVRTRFSAMEVMGVTALANITNSAVNAGKRIVSALTIDPVKTGFSEYETQINAIQTIMANTSSKGTTLDDVNQALDTLNEYADKTIYNFTEMTRNIGTFTAAGVDLNTSVNAIQGIANLAAVSGSTSQQASTAMYQLSQALASGTVKLMDWNSVVNAGMGGEVFQNALKETARVHGVAIDEIIKKNGSFRDSLHEEWLTTDILTETLEKFTMNTKYATKEQIEANKEKLRSIGYTEEQIKGILELGDTATGAATEVKTFSQLWDTLKESAQSGWTQTWEIIVGDFEEAKSFLTTLSKGIGGFIESMSNWRNSLLEGALGSKWGQLTSKINEAGISTEDFNSKFKKVAKEHGIAIDDLIKEHGSLEEAISKGAVSTDLIKETLRGFADEATASSESTKDLNEKLEYFQNVVRKVWRGDYGNMEDRYKALTAAGYDYAQVQALVNKTVDGHELTLEDLTDTQLKSIGYTEEQIKSIRALADEAEKSGTPLNELIQNLDKPSGRTLLIDSLKNAAQGLVKSFTAIKDAWTEIFPPMTSNTLYNIIAGVNKLSEHLRMGDETADKLKRTFKGLFALVDIIFSFIGGPVKIAIKGILELLGLADIPLLDLAAGLGDALVKFRDWIKENNIFVKGIKVVIRYLQKAAKSIKTWLTDAVEPGVGEDIIAGLVGGIWNGMKKVGEVALEIGKKIVNTVKEFLGIHSPSTVFFEIGRNVIQGFVNGIKAVVTPLWNLAKTVVTKLTDIFSELTLDKVLAIGLGTGMFIGLFKLLGVLGDFAKAAAGIVENVGDVLDGIGDMFTGIGKMFKGMGRMFTSVAILNIIIAVVLLAKAVSELASLDVGAGKLWNAVGVIAVLGVVVAGLTVLMSKINKLGGVNLKSTIAVAAIAAGLFLLVLALSKLVTVDLENVSSSLAVLGVVVGALLGIVLLMAALARGSGMVVKAGGTILALSVAMLIMLAVVKMASKMDENAVKKGLTVVGAFTLLAIAIIAASKLAGNNAKQAGKLIMKMSVAMLVMVAVVKLASMIPENEVKRGMSVIALIGGLFAAVLFVSKIAGKNSADAGKTILKMSIAMLAMVAVMKIAATMSKGEIQRGLTVMAAMGLLFVAIIAVSKLAGENAMKAGVMLLAMSGAMLVMVGIIFLVSQMDPSGLDRGVAVVTALGLIVAGLVVVTKFAGEKVLSTLIMLSVVIALLGGFVVGMSFIDPKKLAGATAAMAILMAVFAGLVAVTKFASIGVKAVIAIGVMLVVVSVMASVLAKLATMDAGNALPNAKALALLLGAMVLIMIPLSLVGMLMGSAIKGAIALTVMMAPLAIAVGILAMMKNKGVEPAMDSVKALSVLLGALTLIMIPLALIGALVSVVLPGILALSLMMVPLAAAVLVLAMMKNKGVDDAITSANSLTKLLTTLTLLLVPLALVGAVAPLAISGIGMLMIFIGAIAGLIAAASLLAKIPGLQEFLDRGISLLMQFTEGIGAIIGAFVKGFSTQIMAGLPIMGQQLSDFMDGVTGFIAGAKTVDDSVLKGAGILAGAVGALTVLGLYKGIFSSEDSFAKLGTELSNFMNECQPFIAGAKKLDDSAIAGVKALAEAILILTTADILDGLASFFGLGESALSSFGKQLPQLGADLAAFSTSLTEAGLNEDKIKMVQNAATAVKTLAEVSATIPNSGGWLGGIVGDNDLGVFADQFPKLAIGLRSFINNIGTFAETELTTVDNACKAITSIATAAADIPNQGGILGALAGENNLDSFADQFPKLAIGLRDFVNYIGTFGEEQLTTVKNAATAISEFAGVASKIPNAGGLLGSLVGNNDLKTFADQFPNVGIGIRDFMRYIGELPDDANARLAFAKTAVETLISLANSVPNMGGIFVDLVGTNDLKTFATQFPNVGIGVRQFINAIGELTAGELNSTTKAVEIIKSITSLADINGKDLKKNVEKLGDALTTFSKDINTFSKKMSSKGMTESLEDAADGIRELVSALGTISAEQAGNLKTISTSLEDLGKNGLRSFTEAFAGSDATVKVKTAAKQMVENFANGAKERATILTNVFLLIAMNCYTTLTRQSVYNSFESAGAYLASGLASGIQKDSYKAINAADAMVRAVNKRIQSVALINSPSRMTYEDGMFMVQGLVNALLDGTSGVDAAAEKLANSATSGLTNAIARVSDMIQNGIDAQPTIRPVLDLDAVRAGASQIGGMLSMSPSVGVLSNVNSIASAMSRRGQNGVNDGVISELGKLRKDIAGLKHVSYNIEGINYGEGSEVAEAIETLVRAALMERRK